MEENRITKWYYIWIWEQQDWEVDQEIDGKMRWERMEDYLLEKGGRKEYMKIKYYTFKVFVVECNLSVTTKTALISGHMYVWTLFWVINSLSLSKHFRYTLYMMQSEIVSFLMMRMEIVLEILAHLLFNHLMQLVAQESFIFSVGSQCRRVIVLSFWTYRVIFTS